MGNVQQIEQDLTQLEAKLLAIAQELQGVYEDYLTRLGTVARQQVILVSYYLCTQAAPEQFLQLSLQQKRKLQQGLKGIARALQEQLLLPLQNWNGENPEPERDHSDAENIKAPDNEDDVPLRLVVANNQEDSPITITPRELILWHETVEEHIKHCLRVSSEAANQLLVQYGIVQQPLPEKVLEAAAKAEAASEPIPGPPNLIRVLLEPEGKGAKKKPAAEIIATYLQLADTEFTNSDLTTGRKRLRQLHSQLQKLAQAFYAKHQERAIAAAQGDWRASWFEDEP